MTENLNNDDLLLERFFSNARTQQLDDDGFTSRVMNRLPDHAVRLSRYWTAFCMVAGMVLFLVFKGWQPLIARLVEMVHTTAVSTNLVTLFVTIGALSSLAVLELVSKLDSPMQS